MIYIYYYFVPLFVYIILDVTNCVYINTLANCHFDQEADTLSMCMNSHVSIRKFASFKFWHNYS